MPTTKTQTRHPSVDLTGLLTQHASAAGTAGTVALVAADNAVLAIAATEPNGRFQISAPSVPAGAKLYGFPTLELTAAEVPEAIARRASGLVYEAPIPVGGRPGALIYLNEASTCVCAVLASKTALTPEQADAHVKAHLFGAMVAKFMPGYSAGFLAHIAPPHVLSLRGLQASAAAAGGLPAWGARLATAKPPVRAPFATPRPTGLGSIEGQVEDEPAIPSSANWAADDPAWMDVLSDENSTIADSMSDLAETCDGVAAGVTDTAFATTASDLLKIGAKDLAGGAASAVGSQLFSLVCSWVVGSGSDSTATALTNISAQLTTIVANQVTIIHQLSQVLADLDKLDETLLSLAMTASIANIQSSVQTISGYLTTTGGNSTTTMTQFASGVLSPNGGVVDSLQQIHNIIMGAGDPITLPAAMVAALTKPGAINGAGQNFLSNGNCFTAVQWVFHYYSLIQTQGVQLVIQAQNYQANSAISSVTTPLGVAGAAVATYNNTLIGGAGNGGSPPNLVQQRDLYRATFWPYYNLFQGLLGALPDDMATGLIPHVAGQPGTIYYEINSGLLVLGHLSGKLRNWSAGTDVLAQNSGLLGTSWTLPAQLPAWRYPKQAEFGQIFSPTGGLSGYGGWNLFQYLYDQGFTDDKADYGSGFSFVALFTADGTGTWDDAWYVRTDSFMKPPPFAHPPFDINGNPVAAYMWKDGGSPWNSWHYNFQGTWPAALLANNSYEYMSSQCYNIYAPGDPSQAWAAHPWFWVSGGMVVTDAWVGYLPAGSYAGSCIDIAVTFTCTATLANGSTTQVSFDLTTQGDIALSVVDGVVSVVNPYLPPLVSGVPVFTAGTRTGFLPPGNYPNCTNLMVQLVCQADAGGGQYQAASFNLTPYTLGGVAIANTDGVLTS